MRQNGKTVANIINAINHLKDNPSHVIVCMCEGSNLMECQKKFIIDVFEDKEVEFKETNLLGNRSLWVIDADYKIKQPEPYIPKFEMDYSSSNYYWLKEGLGK